MITPPYANSNYMLAREVISRAIGVVRLRPRHFEKQKALGTQSKRKMRIMRTSTVHHGYIASTQGAYSAYIM